MTKFTLHSEYYNHEKTDGEFVISDNGQPLIATNSYEDAKLVNDLLNELNDENEQLKQQNKMLRTNVGKLTDDVKYLRNLPSTHQKENKQLKKELDCFKPLIFETDGMPITLYEKKDDGDLE